MASPFRTSDASSITNTARPAEPKAFSRCSAICRSAAMGETGSYWLTDGGWSEATKFCSIEIAATLSRNGGR